MDKYILPTLAILSLPISSHAEIKYTNSDQERIEGVHSIVSAIESYKDVIGHPPFSNAPRSRPGLQFIISHITDKNLTDNDYYPPSGITGAHLDITQLLKEFSRRGIDNPNLAYDQREIVTNADCQKYYIYHWNGYKGCYSVSINLDNATDDTYKIGDNCHAYVTSSCDTSNISYEFIRGGKE